MSKDFTAYKTIGEVAKILSLNSNKAKSIPTHTIRCWEKKLFLKILLVIKRI